MCSEKRRGQVNRCKIKKAVDDAKRRLAWLLPIHIALRTRDHEVECWARQLLFQPDKYVCVQNLEGQEKEAARQRAIAAMKELSAFAGCSPPESTGLYLNKSAIVYADAILEALLLAVHEGAGFCEFSRTPSVEKLIETISAKCKENGVGRQGTSFNRLSCVKWARFVAQLRHLIVHRDGFVDRKFRDRMGFGNCKSKAEEADRLELWNDADGKNIWATEEKWAQEFKLEGDACLDIQMIIAPCVTLCARFADAVGRYFLDADGAANQ